MENHDDKNLGQEIQNIVSEAVNSMDFQRLSQDISNTVDSAIENVRRNLNINQMEQENQASQQSHAKKEKNYRIIRDENGRFQKVWVGSEEFNRMMEQQNGEHSQAPVTNQNDRQGQSQVQNQIQPRQTQAVAVRRRPQPLVNSKPAGRISSIVYSLLGGIGTFAFATSVGVLGIVGMAAEPICLLVALGLSPLLLGSVAMLGTGISQSKRLQRFRQYVKLLNGRTYAMLDDFAATLGKSRAFIRKDVQKMISLRMFPYGRLDEEGTCLILNNETWQQYKTLKLQMQEQKVLQQIQEQEQKQLEEKMEADPFQREVVQALKEGENYLQQIKEANDAIPGEEISRKLDDLETIIRKIFEQLKNHPEKIPEMKKFMEYYLPTTLKLVNTYREFDEQALEGENISNGKQEIEKTLVTINKAFLNLFDSLFADTAMDISTDISVLQTMLAQEGLTDSDFEFNK